MRRRQDDSWGVLDWVDLADTIFDVGDVVLEVALEVASGVVEAAGAMVFSLLDGF